MLIFKIFLDTKTFFTFYLAKNTTQVIEQSKKQTAYLNHITWKKYLK